MECSLLSLKHVGTCLHCALKRMRSGLDGNQGNAMRTLSLLHAQMGRLGSNLDAHGHHGQPMEQRHAEDITVTPPPRPATRRPSRIRTDYQNMSYGPAKTSSGQNQSFYED